MKELKKQDRTNSRLPTDTERKYKLGQIELTAEELDKLKSELVVDEYLSITSPNAIANKAVTNALNNKVTKEEGKTLSSNDFTNEDKNNIHTHENKAVLDTITQEKINIWNGGISAVVNKLDVYPIGSTYTNTANTNPKTLLGGEWELIDKQFAWWIAKFDNSSTDSPFVPSENLSSYQIHITRTGHEFRIRLEMTNSIDLDDNTRNLGTFDMAKLGVSSFTYSMLQIPAVTDGGNGMVSIAINHNTGDVESRDIISKTGASIIASGNLMVSNLTIPVSANVMLDEACNQFVWKRIS